MMERTHQRNQRRNNVLTAILMLMLALTLLFNASCSVYAGDSLADCGANLKTSYGGDPKELSISGTGPMFQFSMSTPAPWYEMRSEFVELSIGINVTEITSYAFQGLNNLEVVYLPSSSSLKIKEGAFSGCTALKTVYFGGTENEWNQFKSNQIAASGNDCLLKANIIPRNLGSVTFDFRDPSGKSLKFEWDTYYAELRNTFRLLQAAGLITHDTSYSLSDYIDLDKDGNSDIAAYFYNETGKEKSGISILQSPTLMGQTVSFSLPLIEAGYIYPLDEPYQYFSAATFIFPKKYNGDAGNHTIDLINGDLKVTKKEDITRIFNTLDAAAGGDFSINSKNEGIGSTVYDLDKNSGYDIRVFYDTVNKIITISKLDTCSLKTNKVVTLTAYTKDLMNSTEVDYFGSLTFQLFVDPKSDPLKQLGKDGTPVGSGASAEAAEAAITAFAGEKDIKGTTFAPLCFRSEKQAKKSVTLTWKKVSGTAKYVLYGSPCGNTEKMVRIAEYKTTSCTVKKISGKKLSAGKYYKFMLVALDSGNKVLSTSKVVHVCTKKGSVCNIKLVTTDTKKSKATVYVGKKYKLAGIAVPESGSLTFSKHRALSYETSNPAVATVTKKGVVRGKSAGKAYVYVFAQNGVYQRVKVTVKAAE